MPRERDKPSDLTVLAMLHWFAAIWLIPGVGIAMAFAIFTGTYDPVADDGMAPGGIPRLLRHIGAQFVIALVTTVLFAVRVRLGRYRKVPPEAVVGLLAEIVEIVVFNYRV